MSSNRLGSIVVALDTCQNSMDAAKEKLAELTHGTILHIKHLKAARGRQGRVWQLMPGQFLMTLVLKPEPFLLAHAQALYFLFMAMTLGVLEPLKKYGAGLKWPNDIMMHNKKVAGILMESVWQGAQLKGLVVGFAVNVNNHFKVDDPLCATATSLSDVLGFEFDMQELERSFLQSLNSFYDQWSAGLYQELFQMWKRAQVFVGQQITIHHRDGSVVCGVMQGVCENGDLVVKDGAGKMHIILYTQVAEILS